MSTLRNYFGFITIIFVGSIPLLTLFHPGLPLTHDGQDHVARIANFYQSLSEGNIVPRWAGNLNWGYGHPILMFLYPLPSYGASLVHFLGIPFVESVKIIFGLTFILSGIAMFLFLRNVLGEKAAIVGAVLYMFAPYRFVDLYVRGAIGEHVAFLFIPLVFYFLLQLSKKISYPYILGGSLSLLGLLLSHNAISLMCIPLFLMYALLLINSSKHKRRLVVHYFLVTCLGFGLSSFFLLPAFLEGKYTLRDIVTNHGEYKQGFISIKDFFIPSWSYGGTMFLSKQIGVVQIIGILLAVIYIVKEKTKKYIPLFVLFAGTILVSLFLMLPISDVIWNHISLIQKFQFPWRLLSLVVFSSAVLASFSVLLFKNTKIQVGFIGILIIASVILYYPYYQPQGYLNKPEGFYTGIYKSTTDTGESSPIWSVRFMEHTPKGSTEFIEGIGSIRQINKNTTKRTYRISVTSNTARILENTLYFPNWEVFVDGNKTQIEFQDKLYRGLITYKVPKGEHSVKIIFSDTRVRTIANLLTIFSTALLFLLFFLRKKLYVK